MSHRRVRFHASGFAALPLFALAFATGCGATTTRPESDAPATLITTRAVAAPTAPQHILTTVPSVTAASLEPRLAAPAAPMLLDVRTPEEYAAGHLPGARLIPHDQLAQRLAELAGSRDEEVIVYCRSGRRAALAIDTLKRAGFSRVGHLQGDYQEWSARGGPVEVPGSAGPSRQAR